MYGWRARIGLLVPSSNTTMEPELQKMLPKGISLHTSRMMRSSDSKENLIKMSEYAKKEAKKLATADVNMIIYGCTSGSFIKGEKGNKKLTEELCQSTGKPVITTATAVKRALQTLNMSKLCLVTPYPKEINQKASSWLESSGFEVVKIIQLLTTTYAKSVGNLQIGKIMPQFIYKTVKGSFPLKVDGIFISCTNLRTIKIIDIMEKDSGVPVVSSNQASMWAALRDISYKQASKGFGKLLTE